MCYNSCLATRIARHVTSHMSYRTGAKTNKNTPCHVSCHLRQCHLISQLHADLAIRGSMPCDEALACFGAKQRDLAHKCIGLGTCVLSYFLNLARVRDTSLLSMAALSPSLVVFVTLSEMVQKTSSSTKLFYSCLQAPALDNCMFCFRRESS